MRSCPRKCAARVGKRTWTPSRTSGHRSSWGDARYRRLTHHGAHLWVEDFACPACGAKRRTAAGTPSVKIVAGTYGLSNNPTRLSCGACGQWSASSSELVRHLHPEPTKRLTYLEQNCRAAEPKTRLFTAARSGGSASLRTETVAAIQAALPVEHGDEIEVCRISAIDEAQALEVMQIIPDDGWVVVPITTEGEPRVLGWHQQPPTIDEIAACERVKVREDKKKRASIEKEIRAFSRGTSSRCGIVLPLNYGETSVPLLAEDSAVSAGPTFFTWWSGLRGPFGTHWRLR